SPHKSARNQQTARAIRRAVGKTVRFHCDKAVAVEVIARRLRGALADREITRETRPPQIEIPVRHSQIFILRLGIDRERQCVGAIENAQLAGNEFDVASRKVWIFSSRQTRSHTSRDLDHVLAPQSMRFPGEFGVFLWTKNNLSQPFAIAQINEDHAAMIARDIYPAGKRDLPADIAFTKRIAVVCAKHDQAELTTLKNFATLSSNAP